ncbi:MAG: glycosyltransferase, partial [Ilumatobacteraceae bacterium]
MRIVVLCSDLGVRVPGTKGASIHLDAISRAFVGLGNEVLLVGVAGHGAPPTGMRPVLLPHPGRSQGLRRELRKLAFCRRLTARAVEVVREFQPDVIYERLSLFGTAGLRLAATTGALHALEINALLSEEESDWRSLRLGRLARRRESTVLGRADLRLAVSDELAGRVAARCGRSVDVVPNGVDRQLFEHLPNRDSARQSLGLPLDVPIVGFSGSLRPWHGLDVALDAVARLEGVHLAIAGDGDIRPELAARAERIGVADRTIWLGQLPHASMPAF